MALANLFSIFRIATVPLIIFSIYQESSGWSFFAIILMFLAFLSDVIDGYLVRKKRSSPKHSIGTTTATNNITAAKTITATKKTSKTRTSNNTTTDNMKNISNVGPFLDPFADKILVVCLLFVFFIRQEFSFYFLGVFILRDIIFLIFRSYASREDLDIKQERKYSDIVVTSQFILVFVLLLQELFVNSGYQDVSFTGTLVTFFTIVAIIVSFCSVFLYWVIYSKLVNNKQKIGRLVKREKIVILTNRKARGYMDRHRIKLLKKFASRRKAKLVYLPQTDDMFKNIAGKIRGFKHVIIAGGDGSFESALNCPQFKDKCLGFFPFGAGNAYYSYFYKGKQFEYLRSRFQFREVPLDILELEYDGKKRQTGFLSAGVDSEVPRLTVERTENGFLDYFKAGWKGFKDSKANYDFIVKIDGKKNYLKNCVTLTLAKIPFFGYGLRSLVGSTEMSNKKVYGLAIVNSHTKLSNKPLRLWTFLLTHLNMERDPLVPLLGKEFVVECKEPFPLQAGGEYLGFSQNIKVKVLRQQNILII